MACEARGGNFWYLVPHPFCLCAEDETDPALVAECNQQETCTAQGGEFVWNDPTTSDGPVCSFEDNPDAAAASDAGALGDESD
jgi:hypothetical protein